jgi:hypothetical protein
MSTEPSCNYKRATVMGTVMKQAALPLGFCSHSEDSGNIFSRNVRHSRAARRYVACEGLMQLHIPLLVLLSV